MRALLFGPVGLRRSQLLWRGTGLTVVLAYLAAYHWHFRETHRSFPLAWESFLEFCEAIDGGEEHLFALAGLSLVLFGGRGLTLLAAGVTALLVTWGTALDPNRFPSAELPLFFFLPLSALVVLALERGSDESARERRDVAIARLFRVTLVSSLGFSALHKLNGDFFDVDASCSTKIASWVAEAWGPAGEVVSAFGSPLFTVCAEGGLTLLLLFAPRVAVVGIALFFMPLGLVGAVRITTIMMVMSWAFLRPDDFAPEMARRRWGTFAVLWLALVAASWVIYRANVLGPESIALVEGFTVFSVVVAVLSFVARGRGSAVPSTPLPARMRVVIAMAALLLVLNGFSPYLGLKYNFSFAMWSNLRVDAAGWNSWVVPRAVSLIPVEERYVDVKSIQIVTRSGVLVPRGETPALGFVNGVRGLAAKGGFHVELRVRQNGRLFAFDGGVEEPGLAEMLSQLAAEEGDVLQVRRARIRPDQDYDANYERRLEPALFSSARFRSAIEDLHGKGFRVDIVFRYAGRQHEYEDALVDEDFQSFVEALPVDNLDPGKLDATRPQRCLH